MSVRFGSRLACMICLGYPMGDMLLINTNRAYFVGDARLVRPLQRLITFDHAVCHYMLSRLNHQTVNCMCNLSSQ